MRPGNVSDTYTPKIADHRREMLSLNLGKGPQKQMEQIKEEKEHSSESGSFDPNMPTPNYSGPAGQKSKFNPGSRTTQSKTF